MQYTIIANGKSYDLPPKTMGVVEELERVSEIDNAKGLSIREKFQTIYDFMVGLMGAENTKEILGSDDIDKVDLSDVSITFLKIVDAYDKPVSDHRTAQIKSQTRGLDAVSIDKIIDLAKTAERMGIKGK